MALDHEQAPPESLVLWAQKHPRASGISHPLDRPWYYCPDEIRRTPEGYWALCGSLVKMLRVITPDAKQVLYIGQCGCHGTVKDGNALEDGRIIWAYRSK